MKNTKPQSENAQSEKEKQTTSLKREIFSWIQILVAAAAIAFFLNTFIFANIRVPTASMENTIMCKDRAIGSRLSYYFGHPERGDIATFIFGYTCRKCHAQYQETPEGVCPSCGRADRRNSTIYYVKRVIGLPGDIIDIHDGHVYLNNSEEPLDEPYLAEDMETPYPLHYEVPENCYFMMGDNRNYSLDARYWAIPYIEEDRIIAKIIFRYFPRIGLLK